MRKGMPCPKRMGGEGGGAVAPRRRVRFGSVVFGLPALPSLHPRSHPAITFPAPPSLIARLSRRSQAAAHCRPRAAPPTARTPPARATSTPRTHARHAPTQSRSCLPDGRSHANRQHCFLDRPASRRPAAGHRHARLASPDGPSQGSGAINSFQLGSGLQPPPRRKAIIAPLLRCSTAECLHAPATLSARFTHALRSLYARFTLSPGVVANAGNGFPLSPALGVRDIRPEGGAGSTAAARPRRVPAGGPEPAAPPLSAHS